ncbi:MAG TPA: Lrp/AsnC family transcriptional regulator, partial [Paracoccus sp.]|nr:Lrp/AsnC family transcriptional regulator [Paracoccus sp. (in: a-proteobacteria)]
MICVFVQFRCNPGTTYDVAAAIYDREVVSELYSTSGEYDLIAKVYIPEGQDVGHYLTENLFDVPGISRT